MNKFQFIFFAVLFFIVFIYLERIERTENKYHVTCDAVVNDLHSNDVVCIIHKKEMRNAN